MGLPFFFFFHLVSACVLELFPTAVSPKAFPKAFLLSSVVGPARVYAPPCPFQSTHHALWDRRPLVQLQPWSTTKPEQVGRGGAGMGEGAGGSGRGLQALELCGKL